MFFSKRRETVPTRARRKLALGFEPLEPRLAMSLIGGPFQADNPKTVNTDAGTDTAMSPDGAYSVIVWQDLAAGSNYHSIHAQLYKNNLKTGSVTKVGSELTVDNNNSADDDDPAVAMDTKGDFVVTWAQYPKGYSGNVLARQYDSQAKPYAKGVITVANTPIAEYEPDVACDVNGRFLIAYTTDVGGLTNVLGALYNSDGSLYTSVSIDTSGDNAQQPSVAATKDTGFAIAYYRKVNTPGVYMTEVDDSGKLLYQFPVEQGAGYDHPSVASVGPSLGGVVVYNHEGGFPVARIFVGTGLSNSYQVGTTQIFPLSKPDVAINPTNENFAVAYLQEGPGHPGDPNTARVTVAEMSPTGKLISANPLAKWTSQPSIGMDSSGHYLVGFTALEPPPPGLKSLSQNVKGQVGFLN
jgi:hypothetical protein